MHKVDAKPHVMLCGCRRCRTSRQTSRRPPLLGFKYLDPALCIQVSTAASVSVHIRLTDSSQQLPGRLFNLAVQPMLLQVLGLC